MRDPFGKREFKDIKPVGTERIFRLAGLYRKRRTVLDEDSSQLTNPSCPPTVIVFQVSTIDPFL
jgi:hypothetical protein